MKTALLSFLAATAFGLVLLAGGVLDAAAFVSLHFAAGITAWTFAEYGREHRPLLLAPTVPFPAPRVVRHPAVQVGRLAA
jgi:hypothetical protein